MLKCYNQNMESDSVLISLEIKELSLTEVSFFKIDFAKKTVTYIKNDQLIEHKKIDGNMDEIMHIIQLYIVSFDQKCVDASLIDGKTIEMKIHTTEESIPYYFKNKMPNHYNDFVKKLKQMVRIQ